MGAGSTVFSKNVLGDTMLCTPFHDVEIALYDIDPVRLDESYLVIDAMRILLLGATWPVRTLATVLRACVVCPRRKWFCSVYSFVLLLVNKTLIY